MIMGYRLFHGFGELYRLLGCKSMTDYGNRVLGLMSNCGSKKVRGAKGVYEIYLYGPGDEPGVIVEYVPA